MLSLLVLLLCAAIAPASSLARLLPENFRAPAIPVITADPFMQVWLRGDTATSARATHWDGQPKTTSAVVRVGGNESFQALGQCDAVAPAAPGPATRQNGRDISPGSCDLANFPTSSDEDCNKKCYGNADCVAYVLNTADQNRCYLKSCAQPVVSSAQHIASVIDPTARVCAGGVRQCKQKSVDIFPTKTVFDLQCGQSLAIKLTFLTTLFTDDYALLSRPVYYVDFQVQSLDGLTHTVDVFLSFSGEHVVNSENSQSVQWGSASSSSPPGHRFVKIGNSQQRVLGSKGDRVNIDWGFLYLGGSNGEAALWGGSLRNATESFVASGKLPRVPDEGPSPRPCGDDLPAVSAVINVQARPASNERATFVVGYDDIESVKYFGEEFKGLWTRTYDSIENAMSAAGAEYEKMLAKSNSHDEALLARLAAAGGTEYAQLCALSYRQTLAATKLVWNDNRTIVWNFLKEISTNGDMQTMDVIFPASPMLLLSVMTLRHGHFLPTPTTKLSYVSETRTVRTNLGRIRLLTRQPRHKSQCRLKTLAT